MQRCAPALILAILLGGAHAAAAAQSPGAAATPIPKAVKATHGRALGQNVGIHNRTNGPVSAAACNSRAAAMPGSAGTIGPNGATQSQTIVAIPVGGGNVAAATREQQIAEACAHTRR